MSTQVPDAIREAMTTIAKAVSEGAKGRDLLVIIIALNKVADWMDDLDEQGDPS